MGVLLMNREPSPPPAPNGRPHPRGDEARGSAPFTAQSPADRTP